MGRIVAVHLWDAYGQPLIADIEYEDPEPYRRRAMGFLSPSERNENNVRPNWRGVYRPPICSCEQEPAEGVLVESYEEEEEEGEQ